MELIHFRGLNCYYDCIVSIAASMGKDYTVSFATLWSETDFKYDFCRQVYLSKRMLINLGALGAGLEMLKCGEPEETQESLASFDDDEWIIVGMDAFEIPWNPMFRLQHGPHYFIACKKDTDPLICYDPTYCRENERIEYEEVVKQAFDISRLRRSAGDPRQVKACLSPEREAGEILRSGERLRVYFLEALKGCLTDGTERAVLLAKYTDALISNRYLYRHYLKRRRFLMKSGMDFWNDDFFSEWTAVKNGLYKAAVCRKKEAVLKDVADCFYSLMEKEKAEAELAPRRTV